MNFNIRGLTLKSTPWLVNHHTRIWQAISFAAFTCSQKTLLLHPPELHLARLLLIQEVLFLMVLREAFRLLAASHLVASRRLLLL